MIARLLSGELTSAPDLAVAARTIGTRILAAAEGVPVDRRTARWAFLAARVQPDRSLEQVLRAFEEQVDAAIDRQDTAAALDWTESAEDLARALGEHVAGGVRYARRRVELVHRALADRRPGVLPAPG